MDYDKLIERLRKEAYGSDIEELLLEASTALSTLQAENKRLNKIVCSIPTTPDSGRTVSQYDKEMSMCAYLDDLEAENEKLRAELGRMEEIMRYTGLETEEIELLAKQRDLYVDACGELPLKRIRELAQADQEGKIPKYTIGDTVYDRFGCAWEVISVELHSIRTKNEWLYRCGHKGTDDYCALWYFEAFPNKEAALRREQDGE